ncbi:hypothetical protein ACFL2Z_03840 [Candidatus Eisenbacteria bacterium]|uniref:Uncharacterized protein n=1 Tax=Eiseniibacteriota bacterium TaxID=2212470 RepID=A0ABV6YPM0_UNCEI
MARKFMFVCFGILALAVAFHLGAESADSQGTGAFTGFSVIYVPDEGTYSFLALQEDGTLYWGAVYGPWHWPTEWLTLGQIPYGTATQSTTWGEIKAEYGE